MTSKDKRFRRLCNKAYEFAYNQGIEINNYEATDIDVEGNDIHVYN